MTPVKAQCATADQRVTYVYGVAGASHGRQAVLPRFEGIVPDAPVYPLVHGDLMAFVSAVPSDRFGADEFRTSLSDTDWLKKRILAHEKVLEELRSSDDVVPFRFGTVYLDSSHVAAMLALHRAALCQALERIRGASEWGVKLYCDADVLRRWIESESDSILHLRDMLAQATPGARFFLQKKYVRAIDGEAAVMIASWVKRIQRSLDKSAREAREIEVQPPALHGRSKAMVMNAAYLVSKESLTRFRQAIVALQDEFAAYGFDHELTGPWPPYHFVSLLQEGAADAATSNQ
jgi:Gas vesicle synthesis protein GvpL/GvpF